MRAFFLPLLGALTVSACSEQDARPAKEVVAQAKAAAADAKATAHEAAQDAKGTAETAGAALQNGVNSAAEATRNGVDNVAQGVRELGQGGVVTGRVSTFSGGHLALRPEAAGPADLRVDDRTRYLLHGGGLGRASLPAGTRVKATYIVEAQVPIATEVEVLSR